MITRREKSFFRMGAGEFIGAAVVTPIIFIIILFIVNVLQISVCEQKLIYAAYSCGREAVLSYNQDEAQVKANDRLSEIYTNGENVTVEVLPIKRNSSNWTKGNMVLIKVQENLNPVLGLQRGEHARFTIMMIEHSQWGDETISY